MYSSFTGGLGCSGLLHLLYLKRTIVITTGISALLLLNTGTASNPGYSSNSEKRLEIIDKKISENSAYKKQYDEFYEVFCAVYYDCENKPGQLSAEKINEQLKWLKENCNDCQSYAYANVLKSEQEHYSIVSIFVKRAIEQFKPRTLAERRQLASQLQKHLVYKNRKQNCN